MNHAVLGFTLSSYLHTFAERIQNVLIAYVSCIACNVSSRATFSTTARVKSRHVSGYQFSPLKNSRDHSSVVRDQNSLLALTRARALTRACVCGGSQDIGLTVFDARVESRRQPLGGVRVTLQPRAGRRTPPQLYGQLRLTEPNKEFLKCVNSCLQGRSCVCDDFVVYVFTHLTNPIEPNVSRLLCC